MKLRLSIWLCAFILLTAVISGAFDAIAWIGITVGDPPPSGHKPAISNLLSWGSLVALGVALWLALQFAGSLTLRLVDHLPGLRKTPTFSRTSLVSRLAILAALPLASAMTGDWGDASSDVGVILIVIGAALTLPLVAIWLLMRKAPVAEIIE